MAKDTDIPDGGKITLMMNAAQVGEMDQLALNHRLKTKTPITRSYVIFKALASVDMKKLAKQLEAEAKS